MNKPAGEEVVEARKLTKCFQDRCAVDGVDFTVTAGKCFGFLGPNGAGKTTTLRMILGLTPVTSGELNVFGLDVSRHAAEIRARTGVVPQTDNLDPDFSVAENLAMYARYYGLPAAQIPARVDGLLAFAELTGRRDARTDALSGGMQRRLTIARALINDPDMVVLDEPTTGLDPQVRHVIWGRLAELKDRGKTLLLTTHYMEEAERLCDELVIMDHGRILDQGSPRELVARHVEPEVIELRGAGDDILNRFTPNAQCRIEPIGTSFYCYTQDSAEILAQLREVPEVNFMHRSSGLEDVFLRLTGKELRD